MIDVAFAIDAEAVPVVRLGPPSGGYDAGGNYLAEMRPEVAIMATVQPVSGQALKDMPEGIRTEAQWMIWSRSEIGLDDHIQANGQTYRILYVWPRIDGAFYRAAMGRL